jgi:nanoRNase/pAp phosphatase (c-di-AMP/oligoRNAs hydrolase)
MEKKRLVTRSDFDGLVCAAILKELDIINEIYFAHPKDMQDGLVEITDKDIITNLPYVDGCFLCFDHHLSETIRNTAWNKKHIIDSNAPSAARVVYDYYKDKDNLKNISDEMMEAVDKADSAKFSLDDILNPTDWVLLSFLMDSRTGLGRFKDFKISNFQLMEDLIDYCRKIPIKEILEIDDVKQRVDLYFEHQEGFRTLINENSMVYKNLLVVDLKDKDLIYTGNRFLKYGLFPECNISIQKMKAKDPNKTVLTVGNSIINRTSKTNIGELMLKYGGGGHKNAGTCQIDNDKVSEVLKEIIEVITSNG